MANNFKFLESKTKTGKFRDNYNRTNDGTGTCGYLGSPVGIGGIYPYTYRYFGGNDGFRATCIKSHFQQDRFALTRNFGKAYNKSLVFSKFKFTHLDLECSDKTFRQTILRVRDEDRPSSFQGNEFFVDFISMGAVRYESSHKRCGGRFIFLIHGYEQPFAVESFFDSLYFLRLHAIHLLYKDSIDSYGNQGKPNTEK